MDVRAAIEPFHAVTNATTAITRAQGVGNCRSFGLELGGLRGLGSLQLLGLIKV